MLFLRSQNKNHYASTIPNRRPENKAPKVPDLIIDKLLRIEIPEAHPTVVMQAVISRCAVGCFHDVAVSHQTPGKDPQTVDNGDEFPREPGEYGGNA